MDDAIVLSDDEPTTSSAGNLKNEGKEDDDECIIIEETTIMQSEDNDKGVVKSTDVNTTENLTIQQNIEHATSKSFSKVLKLKLVFRGSVELSSTSFSFSELVSTKTKISINDKNRPKSSLHSAMDELDQLIMKQQSSSKESHSTIDLDEDIAVVSISNSSSSSQVQQIVKNKAEKRKLTDEDREKLKESREYAKKAKESEKEKKRDEARTKKEEKEKEKEMRKIEREMSASLNSKCELYTFCHIGKTVFQNYVGLEAEIRMLYSDRKIENQLKIEDDMGMRIEWRRKCLELREDEDGKCERFEYSSTQDLFAVVVPADTLKDVISANTIEDFIVEQRASFRSGRSTMIIISFGKLDLNKKKLHPLSLEIYEKHRAQIVQLDNISELALFTAQYLRSLARREKKRMDVRREDSGEIKGGGGGHKIQYHGDKGITIGTRQEIVEDWWNKMLCTIDRLSDAQRRAVIKLIPDPIAAINKYKTMDYSDAIQEIGGLVAENGRRVGPVMAHRIFTMLNDETGTAIVE